MIGLVLAVAVAGAGAPPDWQFEGPPVVQGQGQGQGQDWAFDGCAAGAEPHPRYSDEVCRQAIRQRKRLLVAVGSPEHIDMAAAAAANSRWLFAVDEAAAGRFGPGLHVLVPADDELYVETAQAELAEVVSGERCLPCALAKQWLADHGVPYTEKPAAVDDRRGVPRITYRGREIAGYNPEALAALVRRRY